MILITRPREQSKNLETAINLKGHKTFLESLYKIKYYKAKVSYNKNNYYIFPSIHSVHSLISSKQIQKFREANILVIGKKAKQALIDIGCKKIIFTAVDSDTLVKKISKSQFKKNNYVYLCSNIINEDLLKKIDKYQINFEKKIIYKTTSVKKLRKKLINDLKLRNIMGATFLSKLAAETFLSLLSRYKCLNIVKDINIYCISDRVALPFRDNLFTSIFIARQPNEAAIIKIIKKKHIL